MRWCIKDYLQIRISVINFIKALYITASFDVQPCPISNEYTVPGGGEISTDYQILKFTLCDAAGFLLT